MTNPDTDRKDLSFDSDAGASRSTWIAALLLIAIVAWMGSGLVLPNDPSPEFAKAEAPGAVAVATRQSTAEPVTLYFHAEGQAQPDRDTAIRAETSGDVEAVLVNKGEDVDDGQVIARIDTTSAEASLRQATEELERAQREFDNANALLERGVATADRVAQARATLAAAEAQVTAAEEDVSNATIVAPFAGRIETLTLDAGEFVSLGAEVGRIVDNRPLTVALQVPQQALNRIKNGQTAQVSFITGETRQGTVSFVGTSASSETRTFLAEIDVPNEDSAIPAGISAEIRIPTGQTEAHFISPSIISLNPQGETGVKTVEDARVTFYPIKVVRAEIEGVWVTGLPDTADLITVGQGFVSDGDQVRVRPEPASVAAASRTAREATE